MEFSVESSHVNFRGNAHIRSASVLLVQTATYGNFQSLPTHKSSKDGRTF